MPPPARPGCRPQTVQAEAAGPAAGAGKARPRPNRREPEVWVPQDRRLAWAGGLECEQTPGEAPAPSGGPQSAAQKEEDPRRKQSARPPTKATHESDVRPWEFKSRTPGLQRPHCRYLLS